MGMEWFGSSPFVLLSSSNFELRDALDDDEEDEDN